MLVFCLMMSFFGNVFVQTSSILPIIDISSWIIDDFSTGSSTIMDDRLITAKELDNALQNYGCFLIKGHGLTSQQFESAINSGYELFLIDPQIKKSVEVETGGFMRGYIGFGKESGLDEYFESKEGYSYGYDWGENSLFQNSLQGPNVWPNLENSNHHIDIETLNAMFSFSNKVATSIIAALAYRYQHETNTTLGIDIVGGETISIMRLFHYFSSPPKEMASTNKKPTGSSPHTDWGLLTIITQEMGTNGLQVYLPSKGWIDVSAIPGTLIVNGGDFLRLASGGRYLSPIHRVVSPTMKDRLSYVFFYYPNYHTPFHHRTNFDSEKCSLGSIDEAGSFNTLLCYERSLGKEDDHLNFGEYISKKWEEVYRKDNSQRLGDHSNNKNK